MVPRIGVRDCAASPATGSGNTIGTDAASLSRRGPADGTADSAQALGGGDARVSNEEPQDEREKAGGGSGSGGAGNNGEGGKGGGVKKGGRIGRAVRKGGVARKTADSRPERFFEVSATSQVKIISRMI